MTGYSKSLILEYIIIQMFELSVKSTFSAAHQILDYNGNCANLHGHNWELTVWLRSGKVNRLGICMDYREIKKVIDKAVSDLDHIVLNNHPVFSEINPTSETLARYLYHLLREEFAADPVQVAKVSIAENSDFSVSYFE